MARPDGFNRGKMSLALLIKVIILYVRPTTIEVRGLSLKEFFFGFFLKCLSLENGLNSLLQVFFGIIGNIICKNLERSNKKFI